MKLLISLEELSRLKTIDKAPCECTNCKKSFLVSKKRISDFYNPKRKDLIDFCSQRCYAEFKRSVNSIEVTCKNCSKKLTRTPSRVLKNTFCSHSCSAKYGHLKKKRGFRRSKVEIYLYEEIRSRYPETVILSNSRKELGFEIDIYLPELKLGIEINGIIHYSPIYGVDKLKRIQELDAKKVSECIKNGVFLQVIDVSSQQVFSKSSSEKFLNLALLAIEKRRGDLNSRTP